MLTLLLIGVFSWAFNVPLVKADGTIYLRPDGTIDPATEPIQRIGDVYTLTDDIYNKSIELQRDNIMLDGNGHLLQGSWRFDNLYGIVLSMRKNVTIINMIISNDFFYGIWLDSSSNNKIINNTILGSEVYGIKLSWSNHNFLINNTVMNADGAVSLEYSSLNTLSNNKVIDNLEGISLLWSEKNTFRDNVMAANKYHFDVGVFSPRIYHFHDIDTSNTVDGKPIYYWINRHNETVPLDAGWVVIVDSSNITVKNLKLKNNWYGVKLAYTRNSLIENVTATANRFGICLDHSRYNVITKNNITDSAPGGIILGYSAHNNVTYNFVSNTNGSGIWLEDTCWNTLIGNNVANSHPGFAAQEFDGSGILVDDSHHCKVIDNNLSRNTFGVSVGAFLASHNLIVRNNIVMSSKIGLVLGEARNNTIYHNNFVENKLQVGTYWITRNTLDSGYPSGGNYWSDYTGVDNYSGPYQNETGSDGIGDSPYIIDERNQDNYPLVEPWSPKPPSPVKVLEELVQTVESWNLGTGIETSLTSKPQAAHRLLNMENRKAPISQLKAFVNEAEALRLKKLTSEQADYLIAEAQRIIDLINE